jgi:hypothetical protein
VPKVAAHSSQVLRLTLLASEIVEAVLDGREPAELQRMICWMGFRWSGRGNSASSAGSRIGGNDTGKRTLLARPHESALRQIAVMSAKYAQGPSCGTERPVLIKRRMVALENGDDLNGR